MPRAAVALGSNVPSQCGNLRSNLETSVARVSALGEIQAVSTFHDTAPVGLVDQPRFLNGVLILQTELDPLLLLRSLLAIERGMGRDRASAPPKGPRIIDLDLILYDDLVVATEELTLPHPEMHRRAFVLEPLAEVLPEWEHPLLRKTVAEMLQALHKRSAGI